MWTSERFNERFFLFIKRTVPGMVFYVRANTLLELKVTADTCLLLLTPRVSNGDDPFSFLENHVGGKHHPIVPSPHSDLLQYQYELLGSII